MTNWISCEERLPEDDVEVIVFFSPYITCATRWDGEWSRYATQVTHWMPLPLPPDEGFR